MLNKPNNLMINIRGHDVHVLTSGESDNNVLLLHGARFEAQTWQEIDTINTLTEQGYRAIAIDLPGFGQSAVAHEDPVEWLTECLTTLKAQNIVIVSPSMSGQYAIPLVIKQPSLLKGWVAIAPVGIPRYQPQLENNPTPTLGIWGELDQTVPHAHGEWLTTHMPNAELSIIEQGNHAPYMHHTESFHKILLPFLEKSFTTTS